MHGRHSDVSIAAKLGERFVLRSISMDINAWLAELGLAQYGQLFQVNAIDAGVLHQLSDTDLKELGVSALGHRKKLLAAISTLDTQAAVDSSSTTAERRQLTVMFVDLVGSTALSSRLDPEDLRALIREYQNVAAGEVSRFSGHVAQFMGDGVLAYFGWPRTYEDNAERAVRTALALTAAVAKPLALGSDTLQIRIGIATGPVVVGDLIEEGIAQRQTAIGETPNVAARLQSLAAPGAILIAKSTRDLLGDTFALEPQGSHDIKGITAPIELYRVVSENTQESRFAARHANEFSPLIGREEELSLLRERWRRAKQREGQLVLLRGDAGIGKSRLAESLIQDVRTEENFVLRYQCSPYYIDSSLYPITQQLSHAAGFASDDNDDQRLDKLEILLARGADDAKSAVPFIASLLGIDASNRFGELTLTPQQKRAKTLEMLVDQLIGLSDARPVLWIFEDAHWIDPTTLELIELALERVSSSRVLMLITARPTFSAPFSAHSLCCELVLSRLSRDAAHSLLLAQAHGRPIRKEVVEQVLAKTDGVPLFIEEMTRAILEARQFGEEQGDDAIRDAQFSSTVPAMLQDSLLARLDRLPAAKAVAQMAAVIGRTFDFPTLSALAAEPQIELDAPLQQLVQSNLVFKRGSAPNVIYTFKHALVRDIAYETLLKSTRHELHGKLFAQLKKAGKTVPEVLAWHAEASGDLTGALENWERAGGQALARSAYQEALSHLGNAIRLCHGLGRDDEIKRREQALQIQRGQALIAYRGYATTATMEAFECALALAEELKDIKLELPAAYGLLAFKYVSGRSTHEAAERFFTLAKAQQAEGPRLVAKRHLGLARFHAGKFNEAAALLQDTVALSESNARRELMLRFGQDNQVAACTYLAIARWILGYPTSAAALAEQALEWARPLDHANTLAYTLTMGVCLTNICARQPRRVAQAAEEAALHAEKYSLAVFRVWTKIDLAWARIHLALQSDCDEFEAGLYAKERTGTGRFQPWQWSLAAELRLLVGQPQEANSCISRAFELLEAGDDVAFSSEIYRQRAQVLLQLNAANYDAAVADLLSSLEIAKKQEALSWQLRAARDLARLWGEAGDRRRAVDLLAPIHSRFSEGFETADLKESGILLSELAN